VLLHIRQVAWKDTVFVVFGQVLYGKLSPVHFW